MLVLLAFQAEAAPVACNFENPRGGYGGRVTAEWITGEQARAEEAKLAAAELRPPNATPANGLLVFSVFRVTIELANAENYLVVLDSGGVELLRHQPAWKVSWGKALMGWANTIAVEVPDTWTAAQPLEVHIADRTYASRCDWRVTNGVLVKVK